MARLKLRKLESYLEDVKPFEEPKISLEQYPTRAHIAAAVLHTAQSHYGDVEGRLVADLGCGCGVLSCGAAMLGAAAVVGFDVDEDALATARENFEVLEVDHHVDLVQVDVCRSDFANDRWRKSVDVVVTNPPFGTKRNKGADLKFVEAGLAMATHAVYSLHKSATRQHILKKAKDWGVECQVVAQLRYDLPASYKHHKLASVDIDVDFVRFSFNK